MTVWTPWGEYESMDDYLDDGDYRPWPWTGQVVNAVDHLRLVPDTGEPA